MALIEVHNLEKEYSDGTRALSGVSFAVEKGEFVAIVGHSGSGKSTLLHILGFLDVETSGVYRFNGKSFDEYGAEEVAHTRNKEFGFVFQMFNLLPHMTVLENVKLPLLYSLVHEALWDKHARRAIESVGLTHRVNHGASELSGGERQRAAIARALVNNPKVVFADEPTGNLDSKSGGLVLETIQKLNEEGHTIILVTHESYTAEHAGRIIELSDGKIIRDEKVSHRRRAHEGFLK